MTDTNLQNKARAVVLAALMVLSVMVGTIALSGGAAAAGSNLTLSDGTVTSSTEVTVTATASTPGNDLTFVFDSDQSGAISSSELLATKSTDSETGEASVSFTPSSKISEGDGDYTVYVVEEGNNNGADDTEYSIGNPGEYYDSSSTLTVDGTQPVGEDASPSDSATISDKTPSISLNLSEEHSSINVSTIEVGITDTADEQLFYRLDATEAQGISFSEGTLTMDIAQSKLDQLPEGDINVEVGAKDEAGNALTGKTTWDFTVDSNPVSVSIDSAPGEGTVVTTDSQTFKVSVTSTSADIDTAQVTISGEGYSETLTNENSDVFSSGTFTIDAASDGDIPTLPEGDITVEATATDADGKSASAMRSFSVDTNSPSVESVTVNDGFAINTGNASSVPVTVTFNETVNPATVTGEIHLNDDKTAEVTLGSGGVSHVAEKSDGPTVTYDVDLSSATVGSAYENESAEVRFSAAADDDSNLNDALDTTETFSIDTIEPTVSENSDPNDLPTTVSGVVDFQGSYSVSNSEGGEPVFEIRPAVSDKEKHYVALSKFDDLADFDTTVLPEGEYDLRVSVTDDDGNSAKKTPTLKVDNADPSVSYEGSDVLTGEVNVTKILNVQDDGLEVVDYHYRFFTEGTSLVEPNSGNIGDWEDGNLFNVNKEGGDGQYVLVAEVDDPGYDGDTHYLTTVVESKVLDDNGISIEAKENPDHSGRVLINVTSDVPLSEFNVTVKNNDDYHEEFSTVFEATSPDLESNDFENVSEGVDGYKYTTGTASLRDGKYTVTLNNASSGQQFSEFEMSSDATLDTGAPSLEDADIIGSDKGHTQVELTFSEPIKNLEAGDITYRDGDVKALGVTAGEKDGVYVVTFDTEIQTGDGAKLTVGADSYNEEFNNDDSTANEKDSMKVDSVELDLQKGANLVSIPVESGSVDLDHVDLDHVNVIWAYDNGDWDSYDPGAKHGENDFSALKGGQGYVFMVDHKKGATIDVRGYTAPAPDDDSGATPSVPTMEGLKKGWNLVGHYQEGAQPTSQALKAVDHTVTGVGPLGQANDYSYNNVDTFVPGEAYWVYVDGADMYTAVDYSGEDSDISPPINSVSAGEANPDADTDDTVSSSEQITVTADVSGTSMVSVDASSLNEGTLQLTSDGDGFSKTFSVAGDFDGTKTLTVEAAYSDGTTTTQTVDVNVDTTDSSVTKSSFPSSDVTGTADVTDYFSVTSSDGGLTTYEYSTDGGSSWTDITSSASSFDTTTLSDGSVMLKATDTDDAGNSASASGTVTVDNNQPTATWDNTGFTVSSTYDLTADSSTTDADSTTYAYSTDGTTWTTISDGTSWDTSGLSDGDVTVRVTETDAQGNSVSDTTTVTVDNVQPSASWASSFDGSTVSGSYDLTAQDTSQNAGSTTYEYSTDGGSTWTTISDGANWDTTQVTNGDVTVRVTVTDTQANSDSATATVTVSN